MVIVNVRYVIERRGRSGATRRYWSRPGYDMVRLPDEGWIGAADRLNAAADAGQLGKRKARRRCPGGADSVAAWCDRYEATREGASGVKVPFAALARSTRSNYGRQLRRWRELVGHFPIQAVSRGAVMDYLDGIPTVALRRVARNVIRNVLEMAYAYGSVAANHANDLQIATTAPRQQLWSAEDLREWLANVETPNSNGRWIVMTLLMLYTAQRSSDVLNMTRADYDGLTIRVTQQKTKAKLAIRCHKELKAALDAWLARPQKVASIYIVAGRSGQRLSYSRIRNHAAEVLERLGRRHLHLHDIRRTAITKLAEAGCTVPQIASISGHSVKTVQSIMDTYIVPTEALAKSAIEMWEAAS